MTLANATHAAPSHERRLTAINLWRPRLELFALSFAALFLELMVIRWGPSVVRLIAYYANLMLISSFLGLGVGAMLGRGRHSLFRWFPILLAVDVFYLLIARHVTLPGSEEEARFYALQQHILNYLTLVGVFLTNAVLFLPLGQQIGRLFDRLPVLQAYAWDLGGSLAGTLTFGLFSFTHFSPLLGMSFVMLLILTFSPRSQWLWMAPLFGLTLWGVTTSNDPAAIWSPYYYIMVHEAGSAPQKGPAPSIAEPPAGLRTVINPTGYSITVNHDFYQPHMTLNLKRYSQDHQLPIRVMRVAYDLPYRVALSHQRVLVLGAGGGTDAEVALLNGAEHVDAVEIDRALVTLSKKFNASGVYDDPRVQVHIDDARAFIQRARPGFDMVVFGWLDSQALFSSMSNLRLDGYVYTVESIRRAYALLNEHGMLALSFCVARPWLTEKLVEMVQQATGSPPLLYIDRNKVIICAPRNSHRTPPESYGRFKRIEVAPHDASHIDVSTDNWPYLYLSRRTIPMDYLIVIIILVAISLPLVFVIRGTGFSRNDAHFLFMGMGFLLLETKSIGDCSLYFGTTWLVTTIVVAGVLIMVLAANLTAMRMAKYSAWMYAPLIASVLLLYWLPRDTILALPFSQRMLWALFVVPLPIFFAGLIFSTTFRGGSSPSSLFGANLVGAMLGGFSEYLGMMTGNGALALLVIAAYLASLFCRGNRA